MQTSFFHTVFNLDQLYLKYLGMLQKSDEVVLQLVSSYNAERG